ncbi:MAG: hypothetical protein WCC05_10480, partial [Candidatus Sulfotelmatobacter sp.]
NLLSIQKSFDIYASTLRILAVFQIVLMVVGTVFLCTIVREHHPSAVTPATHNLEIKLDSQHTVIYPIDADKNTTVEIDGGKVKITTAK